MKRCLTVLALALIAASVQKVSAQYPNPSPLPFTNSYETVEADTSTVVGASVLANPAFGSWAGAEGSVAYVTNVTYTAKANSPLGESVTHSNIMVFSTEGGEISNEFVSSTDSMDITNFHPHIYIDTMIRPVFSEELPMNASVTTSQLSVSFNTNGNICIFHGLADTWDGALSSNKWSAFSGEPVVSGQWVRLTVEMNYNFDDANRAFFRAQINGVMLSNEFGFANVTAGEINHPGTTQPGPWFRAANDGLVRLAQIALSGTGGLDDLLVSTNAPVVSRLATINVISSAGGTVTPSGVIYLPTTGGSTNFLIHPASRFWQITSVAKNTNNVVEALGTNDYTLAWSDVSGDNTLSVNFTALVAGNGIPYEWLANHGLDINDHPTSSWEDLSAGDWDGDGLTTYQEWLAGTLPADSNSVLKVLSQIMTNGAPVISWKSGTGGLNGAPYLIQGSSNLLSWTTRDWSYVTTPGTNLWYETQTNLTRGFYRVRVDTTTP